MSWDLIGAVAELIAAVGVIASLLYLATQVRQGTVQQRQDHFERSISAWIDAFHVVYRDPQAFAMMKKGLQSFDDLPDAERAFVNSCLMDMVFHYDKLHRTMKAGLLDAPTATTSQQYLVAVLTTPGGAQWWTFARATKVAPQFLLDHIDDLLARPGWRPIEELMPWYA